MKKFVQFLIIFILIVTAFILYARFIGTRGLKVNEYKIINSNLTDKYHGLKIVQISDIHYGSTIFEKELNDLVNKINFIKPDIVVLTGDLIDKKYEYDKEIIISYLSKIKTTIGKFAISGNHDFIDDYKIILDDSNFKLIDNNYELIYKDNLPIIISGLASAGENVNIKTENFDKFYSESETKPIFSILLAHEPDQVDELNLNNYDLILAGHSHGGQVKIPFIYSLALPKGAKKYDQKYYKLNNTDLYVSNGIGTSIMRLRLFNKPSINFFRLTNR